MHISQVIRCQAFFPTLLPAEYLVVILKVCDEQDEYRQKVCTLPTYTKIYWYLIKFHPSRITFSGKTIRVIYRSKKCCPNDQTDTGLSIFQNLENLGSLFLFPQKGYFSISRRIDRFNSSVTCHDILMAMPFLNPYIGRIVCPR